MNREISVYVCGSTWAELTRWTLVFEQFFGGATTVRGRGTWDGVLEAVNVVSHLFDAKTPDYKYYELDQLVRQYKREAQQETVLIVERKVYTRLI